MLSESAPRDAAAAAPHPATSVTVQINVSGHGNVVRINDSTIGEALSSRGGSDRPKAIGPRLGLAPTLIGIANRVAVSMGNEIAAIVIAWLNLLGC